MLIIIFHSYECRCVSTKMLATHTTTGLARLKKKKKIPGSTKYKKDIFNVENWIGVETSVKIVQLNKDNKMCFNQRQIHDTICTMQPRPVPSMTN